MRKLKYEYGLIDATEKCFHHVINMLAPKGHSIQRWILQKQKH
jgi:hypothetical protein